MIRKDKLWFLTLFTLILVLGVYYITMPFDVLKEEDTTLVTKEENSSSKTTKVEESELLVALEVEKEDERMEEKKVLEDILNNGKSTSEEKNDAYLKLKYIDEVQGQEDILKKKIKDNFSLNSFVKIDNKNISVVILKKDHDTKLASEIMKCIEDEYEDKVFVSIKFQK